MTGNVCVTVRARGRHVTVAWPSRDDRTDVVALTDPRVEDDAEDGAFARVLELREREVVEVAHEARADRAAAAAGRAHRTDEVDVDQLPELTWHRHAANGLQAGEARRRIVRRKYPLRTEPGVPQKNVILPEPH